MCKCTVLGNFRNQEPLECRKVNDAESLIVINEGFFKRYVMLCLMKLNNEKMFILL